MVRGRTCFYCTEWLNNDTKAREHYETVHPDLAVWGVEKEKQFIESFSWHCYLCYMDGEYTKVNNENYEMHLQGRHDASLTGTPNVIDSPPAEVRRMLDADNRS